MFKTAYLTDTGLKRDHNEDSLYVGDNIFVVADGMGGHEKGEIASQIVVDAFESVLGDGDYDTIVPSDDETLNGYEFENIKTTLNGIITTSISKIKEYAKENNIDSTVGTTVVGMYKSADYDKAVLFHIGDSRIYRVRATKIYQLTTDHSHYEDMKRSGKYSEEQLSEIGTNRITKAIGNFQQFPLELSEEYFQKDDIYLICSDGVSDLVDAKTIENTISENSEDLYKICTILKDKVYKNGAKDNLTMIVIKVLLN